MLLYLFFDSLLSTCPKKMTTEKWPKAADSPLLISRAMCFVCPRVFVVQSGLSVYPGIRRIYRRHIKPGRPTRRRFTDGNGVQTRIRVIYIYNKGSLAYILSDFATELVLYVYMFNVYAFRYGT